MVQSVVVVECKKSICPMVILDEQVFVYIGFFVCCS